MGSPKMVDIPGIPEYFMTEVGRTEGAGGDCVRIYNCVERGGFLIPQCTVIIPARSLIVASRVVSEAAQKVFAIEHAEKRQPIRHH
jgi:hypothetical protein